MVACWFIMTRTCYHLLVVKYDKGVKLWLFFAVIVV